MAREPIMCAIHVLSMGRSFFWTFYMRDAQDRVVRRESVDRTGHQYTSATTRFSEDDLTSSAEFRSANGAIQYTESTAYSVSGKPIQSVRVRPNGVQWKTTVYTYDQHDQLIEEVETQVSNGEVLRKRYTYDNEGNRLSETVQGPDGLSRTDYTYDEANRVQSERQVDVENNVDTIDHQYQLGDQGQIETVQRSHRESGELWGQSIYYYAEDSQLLKIESINRQGQRDAEIYYLCDGLDVLE